MEPRGKLKSEIEEFVASCRDPVFLEPGEEPLRLVPGSFAIGNRRGHTVVDVWDETRNLSRRIVGLGARRPGRIEVTIERFGKRKGVAVLLDQARPSNRGVALQGRRQVFREQFRHFLLRNFPGWKLASISTDPDLEHTLSPAYPRALLHRGSSAWAAIGASTEFGSSSGALAFGLIWLDYLRRRVTQQVVNGLVLYLPAGEHVATCLRMRWLDSRLARYVLFVHGADGGEERLDPRDYGNLRSRLDPWRTPEPASEALASRLAGLAGVEVIAVQDGQYSIRVRGLELARAGGAAIEVGIDRKHRVGGDPATAIAGLAAGLARLRSPEAAGTRHPLSDRAPEAWLESQVRAHLESLDPALLPSPVYGQVPAVAGLDRGILDLLATGHDGRLAVLELKASADVQLPLQALDYWMRVRHHNEAGEFTRKGYFPGTPLSPRTPRLLLVAPALEFHPTTETLLRYLDPEVPVERIGLASDWRRQPRVVLRAAGAAHPGTF